MNSLRNEVIVEPKFVELKPVKPTKHVPSYLIEYSGSHFYIHRELNKGERTYYDTTRLFSFNKKLYLKNINIINTFQDAFRYVEHIWGNTETFNMMPQYDNQ